MPLREFSPGWFFEMKGAGREFRIAKLAEHMNHPDPVVSLKALDMGFKLSGDDQEGKNQPTGGITFLDIDLDGCR